MLFRAQLETTASARTTAPLNEKSVEWATRHMPVARKRNSDLAFRVRENTEQPRR